MAGEVKTPFWRSLWCVCCGTGIFPALREHSTARTLWHLALMSLLAGAIVTVGVSGSLDAELAGCGRNFTAAFGDSIRLSERGIVPAKRPPVPFFLPLPAGGGLFYTSGGRGVEFPPGFFDRHRYFFVWSDVAIAAGTRSGDEWQIQLVDPAQKTRIVRSGEAGIPALIAAELRRSPVSWKLPEASIDTKDMFKLAGRIVAVLTFLTEFFGCLLLALVCTGSFALFSRFTGASALRGLTGGAYWRIGVYAGFPGMLLGGVCEALQLPYVTYGIIYVTALVFYWLPASLACAEDGGGDGGARKDA